MYLNKAIVVGNLTRDPELKQLPSGASVTSFGLATNRRYKDKDGNTQDQTEYHNLVSFGKQAELIAQYLRKGSQALIEGRIQTRSWESDGQKHYRTEIVVEQVQFGAKREQADGQREHIQQQANRALKKDTPEYPEEDINPEDIPF